MNRPEVILYAALSLVGGARLIASFREAGLIDTYILSVIPVLLGRGMPLFEPVDAAGSLELRSSRAFPNGVVQMEYSLVKS